MEAVKNSTGIPLDPDGVHEPHPDTTTDPADGWN